MEKQRLHKSVSILMAFLVLFSTVSFAIEKHFCGDTLIDVAVFSKPDNCGTDAYSTTTLNVKEKHCCSDEVEIIKGQDQLKLSVFEDINFDQQIFLVSYVYTYISCLEVLSQHVVPFQNYFPPHVIRDIQVLDQVFII